MSIRRFAVVASIVALLLGSVGSVAIYEVLRSDADSPVPMILQACVEGDSDSCYSFAGLKMSGNRDMALAALEMCAADKRSDFLFDCMFKLAQAYQTGRSGQRSFVMAYQWYSTLIAEDGPAAFLEVARSRVRSVKLVMSKEQISMAEAQTKSWLGKPADPDPVPIAVGIGTRL